MRRRHFIAGLAAALGTTSYFDMGASWKKREIGLLVIEDNWVPQGTVLGIDRDALEPFLKEYYNGKKVHDLIFASPKDLFAGIT